MGHIGVDGRNLQELWMLPVRLIGHSAPGLANGFSARYVSVVVLVAWDGLNVGFGELIVGIELYPVAIEHRFGYTIKTTRRKKRFFTLRVKSRRHVELSRCAP